MSRLGVLLVGPGWVAEQHIVAYLQNPDIEIRAIAGAGDRDRSRAEAYMKGHGFECPYFGDWEAALRCDGIDLLSICTVNGLHCRISLAALEAGKHVFVEKPMCLFPGESSMLVEAARQAGTQTHVGHVVRYYPSIQRLWRFTRNGGIGEVFYCESDYWHEITGDWKTTARTAGSSLLMGGCHSVDLVLWMVGEERRVEEVFAYSAKARRRRDFEYDPTISVLMKFDNGILGRVSTSLEARMPYVFHLQVNGTAGTIRDNGIYSAHFHDAEGFTKLRSGYPSDSDVGDHPFRLEIDDFVDCILTGRESQLSFRRTAKVYDVIFAAERSAREGVPVRLV